MAKISQIYHFFTNTQAADGEGSGENPLEDLDLPTPKPPLSCWHCDAMGFAECLKVGKKKTCHDNEVKSNYCGYWQQMR